MDFLTQDRLRSSFWLCGCFVLALVAAPALADHHEEMAAMPDSAPSDETPSDEDMAEEMAAGEKAHGEMGHEMAADAAAGMDPEMMQAWMAAATPGEAHGHLAEGTGTWHATVTSWMEPGAEPLVSEGTFEREMILGGRVMVEEFTGDFMGHPFHGRALNGYDNVTSRYWSLWTDDMSTGPMIAWGEWDDEVGGVVYVGEQSNPMTGGRTKVKSIVKYLEDGTEVFEMYETHEGGEAKVMEIRSVRQ